ncbi:MAG: hypothetical protein AB4290_03130 [Spirulina sp.]
MSSKSYPQQQLSGQPDRRQMKKKIDLAPKRQTPYEVGISPSIMLDNVLQAMTQPDCSHQPL